MREENRIDIEKKNRRKNRLERNKEWEKCNRKKSKGKNNIRRNG